ncbi:hypothetical protein N7526_009542 [Penicillium atrosanguineum]|nr:hypothetical protein N7526_009542 [Penicillium atrosanguineum]
MTSISFHGNSHGIQVGDNRGSITAGFHLHPERPETPPNPLSTVPYARDPDFVSRDTLLNRIHEKSSVPGSRIALVGLGGVGKSQLAIEYSYQIRTESPATWIFWVHASSEARFEQSFWDIADQVKIPGRQDPAVNIYRLVESQLRDEKKGRWVFILDNADDDEFLCSLPPNGTGTLAREDPNVSIKPLLEYVPRSRNGSVIITSRSREVTLKMVHHQDIIEVKPMEKSEAMKLLQIHLGQPREDQESHLLLEALEYIPLAVVQAASYVREQGSRYSVSKYLRDFRESDRKATRLMEREAGHLYRDWEAKNSILVSWQISFDHIRQIKRSAAELLSLMSFFDRQGIPERLIRLQPEFNHRSTSELLDDSIDGNSSTSDVDFDFEDDIMTLRNYSFISVSENGSSFMMHRLVQLTTRAWLKSHGVMEPWKEIFISNLNRKFPIGKYEHWEKCRSLFPHVRSAMLHRPESQGYLLKWATLLYRGAWYASESGNISDVREMALKSRDERVILLGAEHEEALESTAILARAYSLEGCWEKAEELQIQVMETRKKKLGEDHPDTLSSMASLASTYCSQGQWDEAEKFKLQVVQGRIRKLGEHHPETLKSMTDLSSTYLHQSRWEEAEKLNIQAIATYKRALGADHPDTLLSMASLASTYNGQGRLDEAESLRMQVMKTQRTKLGEDHPHTLASLSSLVGIYIDQGRWDEAEKLNIRLNETCERKLGEAHPHTLTSLNGLAHIHLHQDRYEQAKKLHVQIIETCMKKLDEDHPVTLRSLENLALTYRYQSRWEEAEKLEVQVMETRKRKLGEDHPETLGSMSILASIYTQQGQCSKAEQLQVKVMETRKRKLGEDHPDTLSSMTSLAVAYCRHRRWEEAEQLDVQVMETRKRKLGEDHPDTLSSMANLAFTWKSSGNDAEAVKLLRDCLVKQQQTLGQNHPDTLSTSEALLEWETEKLDING